MGRTRRPYLPGAIFHLTARTLRREHLFTPPLRTLALAEVARAVPRSWCRILAVAIMSNHFHLVVQQGERPLAALMQPLLRRLALRLQQAHGLTGPIFWRHYASRPCLHPAYARNAIAYAHLNPVRAGLCKDPAAYAWTSHAIYATTTEGEIPAELDPLRPLLDPSLALPLFASDYRRTPAGLRSDYLRFLDCRLAADRELAGPDSSREGTEPLSRPPVLPSTTAWGAPATPLFASPDRSFEPHATAAPAQPHLDLADVARRALALEAPGMSMDAVRGRGGNGQRRQLRLVVMRRLHAAGFTNVKIARYLDVSETTVSRALSASSEKGGG